MIPDDFFIRKLIEDEDIIFSKESEYHKQKKKEKKNPIFKRNKSKKDGLFEEVKNDRYKDTRCLSWQSYVLV